MYYSGEDNVANLIRQVKADLFLPCVAFACSSFLLLRSSFGYIHHIFSLMYSVNMYMYIHVDVCIIAPSFVVI